MTNHQERESRRLTMHRQTVVLIVATFGACLAMALLFAGFAYRIHINQQVKTLAVTNCDSIEIIKAILLKNQLAADKNVEQLFPGQLWAREHARHNANIRALQPINCN